MTTSAYRYSPRPPLDYAVPNGIPCGIKAITELTRATATWNLYWLSMPSVDLMPDAGHNWPLVYKSDPLAIRSIVVDVEADDTLYRKLMLHPARFLDWWRNEDASIYDTYDVIGATWKSTVLARATEAAERVAREMEVATRIDNVVFAKFGSRKV